MSDEDVDLDAEELKEAAEALRTALMGIGFTSDEMTPIPRLLELAVEIVGCYESLRAAMEEAASKMDDLNKKASTELLNEVESLAIDAEYVSNDLRNALDSY